MQIFVDSADLADIQRCAALGLADGVTTNPSLIARAGGDIHQRLKEICAAIAGPVSAEVTATDAKTMIEQGEKLAALADNIVVKTPLTWDGLTACRALKQKGHQVNVTLCFSVPQALLAAKAGADFVSPFAGRLDDAGQDGMGLIADLVEVFANYHYYETKVLAASIRSLEHIRQAALAGADIITAPAAVILAMAAHPLTDKGLALFLADWKKTGQVL